MTIYTPIALIRYRCWVWLHATGNALIVLRADLMIYVKSISTCAAGAWHKKKAPAGHICIHMLCICSV